MTARHYYPFAGATATVLLRRLDDSTRPIARLIARRLTAEGDPMLT